MAQRKNSKPRERLDADEKNRGKSCSHARGQAYLCHEGKLEQSNSVN